MPRGIKLSSACGILCMAAFGCCSTSSETFTWVDDMYYYTRSLVRQSKVMFSPNLCTVASYMYGSLNELVVV